MGFKRQFDPEYTKVAKRVRRRDKFTCQMCGAKKCRMNVHHIKLYAKVKSARNDPYNLILLCWKCHRDIRGREHHYAEWLLGIAHDNEERLRRD